MTKKVKLKKSEAKAPKSPSLRATAPAGRKAVISREDVLTAAFALIGPNRSVSSLSLREIARSADIAPNSFYRHFKNVDELTIAMIELAGNSLNKILSDARRRITSQKSTIVTSIEAYMDVLNSDERLLHLLLREGSVGSERYRKVVEVFLQNFEAELCRDLIRLSTAGGKKIEYPQLVAKAITRLVFAQGGYILDRPKKEHPILQEELIRMVRMIVNGGTRD